MELAILPTVASEPYWQGCQEGRLRLQRCQSCHNVFFYPRTLCPHCQSTSLAWEELSGAGKVYTFTIVCRGATASWRERVPYVAALVELAEGPRLMTNIVGCPPEEVYIDMPVRVEFRDENGVRVPVFRPETPRG